MSRVRVRRSKEKKIVSKKMAFLSFFDPLYCQEENFELEVEEEQMGRMQPMPPLPEDLLHEHHLLSAAALAEEWAEVFGSLVAKEGETSPEFLPDGGGTSDEDAYIRSARRDAVQWLTRAAARHAFSALTAMLAVNYLDRCFLSSAASGGLRLQGDKPWMGRLAAVACLSTAAKVEETYVPLLLDLQLAPPTAAGEVAEDSNAYVFEAKTIRRMELLVLSALGWRMNPVTPLSFIHHLVLRLWPKDSDGNASAGGGAAARIRELVKRCETALLSAIADWRWVRYPASVWAAAALLHASETGGGGGNEIRNLIPLLNVSKENMEECCHLITESMAGGGIAGHKRKHSSSSSYSNHYFACPPSPSGVIGSCFSCESSCDSWALWPSSVSSSPEIRPFKRPSCISSNALGSEDEVFTSN